MTFTELAQEIQKRSSKHHQRIVAIDGGGGAGKTTFASHLQKAIEDSFVITMDNFYRPPQARGPVLSTDIVNTNFDWDRFYTSVLLAAQNNTPISYQRYDFHKGTLSGGTTEVPYDATIIIEGVWGMQAAFVDIYDYRIWLDAPPETRLMRGLKRDGEEMREAWEGEWIPIDNRYRDVQKPYLRADIIIDSAESDFFKDHLITKSLNSMSSF